MFPIEAVVSWGEISSRLHRHIVVGSSATVSYGPKDCADCYHIAVRTAEHTELVSPISRGTILVGLFCVYVNILNNTVIPEAVITWIFSFTVRCPNEKFTVKLNRSTGPPKINGVNDSMNSTLLIHTLQVLFKNWAQLVNIFIFHKKDANCSKM